MKRLMSLIALGACLAVSGCSTIGKPGGLFGTGVGDGDVSDFEAGALNIGGELAGVSGAGSKAQKLLGSPSKVQRQEFPQIGATTSYWDSVGTVVKPPISFRIDPEFGSITGRYGVASADVKPATIDPALQAAIEAAVKGALAGAPGSAWIAGRPASASTKDPPPSGAGDDDQAELDEADAEPAR